MARTPVAKSSGSSTLPVAASAATKSISKPRTKKPAKASQAEMDDRRKQVVRLRMRGLGYRSIAKILGIGHMTVKRDLEAIRDANQKRVTQFEHEQTIGECLSVFEEVELKSWEQFDAMPLGSQHGAKYLEQIQDARNNQIKLLTDIGLIRREPAKVDLRVRTEAIAHWTPEAQDLVAMAIIKAKLSPPKEPRPDRIIEAHVEPEPTEPATAGQLNKAAAMGQ